MRQGVTVSGLLHEPACVLEEEEELIRPAQGPEAETAAGEEAGQGGAGREPPLEAVKGCVCVRVSVWWSV
jgi:hypothetical protein